jgi:hypothetical protein
MTSKLQMIHAASIIQNRVHQQFEDNYKNCSDNLEDYNHDQ